ncbi:MAG: ACT domain-containing protein, partial [Pseudomonadota bacterium]
RDFGDIAAHAHAVKSDGVTIGVEHTLGTKNINIDVISTSEIKISVLIDADYTELAVRALHTAFDLDAS